jgi:hypothetical protein
MPKVRAGRLAIGNVYMYSRQLGSGFGVTNSRSHWHGVSSGSGGRDPSAEGDQISRFSCLPSVRFLLSKSTLSCQDALGGCWGRPLCTLAS